MHLISDRKLGIPKISREAFKILGDEEIIDEGLMISLMNMVSFRNIAVHEYQELDIQIVQTIVDEHLDDFLTFTKVIIKEEQTQGSPVLIHS